MSRTEPFVAILTMIVLEIYHLKWIVLTEWNCSTCGVKHKDCRCGRRKWIMYL
jgi:C4-type Zn-finger protein